MDKIAVNGSLLRIAQTRSGRKPMSLETLLRRDREGTLFKKANPLHPILDKARELKTELEDAAHIKLEELGARKIVPTFINKAKELKDELAEKVAKAFAETHPSFYENLEMRAAEAGDQRRHAGGSPKKGDVPTRNVTQEPGFQRVGPYQAFDIEKSAEEPQELTVDELEKVCELYSADLDRLSQAKYAGSAEEMHKEALIGALRKALPSSKVVRLGNETIDLRPQGLSFKGVGKKLEDLGGMYRLPKGVTPEAAQAAGNFRGGSAGGRIFGEGLHSAGHHTAHTTAAGKVLNPLGKPLGGFIEGISRGGGQELQRAGGALATGLSGPAATMGGGVRGAMGRSLERSAPRIGALGELGAAAGSATMLGHAVTPATQGLSALAKATGTYAPLKHHLGSLGFNVAKDTLAVGAETAANTAAVGGKSLGGILAKVMPTALRARQAAGV